MEMSTEAKGLCDGMLFILIDRLL